MSAEVMDSSSPVKESSEPVTKMDTSAELVAEASAEETTTVNGNSDQTVGEDTTVDTKTGKRKRSAKRPVETDETSISSSRPKRGVSKREEQPAPVTTNGSGRTPRAKSKRSSVEQSAGEADDEQDRDKNIPVVHDVADVVWVKMGGHPWWPSLIVRDPNDTTRCFTKVTGNARAKRMYFVVFYGSTADFAWVADAAVIPYKGVEAFTQYAQDVVDKAQTKSQKEQLTERFQLKVTIGRRDDWETAVREADTATKQTSEKRLEEIEPKIQFYTSKLAPSKGQFGRRGNFTDLADRPDLAEKMFDFPSDEESSSDESPEPKSTPSMKIKLNKQASNESDAMATPPPKRRYVRKSNVPAEPVTNGSAKSESPGGSNGDGGVTSARKRGRPRLSKPSVITSNGDVPKKPITKPQAFMNEKEKSNPVSAFNQILVGQHHRFDIRTGFLSPFEEQEVFDAVNQLRPTKTFEEAEQIARRRFEHILCVNLNRTHVDVPEEWFYSFLFAHPILIVKNAHWFDQKVTFDEMKTSTPGNSIENLKRQLVILSKLYRNELQVRSSTV